MQIGRGSGKRWATRNLGTANYQRLVVATACAAVVWIVAAWLISDHNFDRQSLVAVETEAKEAERLAASIGSGIQRSLAVRRGVAATLAADEFVRQSVVLRRDHGTKSASTDSLNRFLAAAEKHLMLDALWVGNASGRGCAAGNVGSAQSPIGVDYSDRIYFQEAKAGRSGYQFAVGKTTGRGGMFFSAPILDGDRFAGFVVSKIDTSRLSVWVDQADALLSDRFGVIVLARDKQLEMRTLPGASVGTLSATERQNQYARTEFRGLRIADWKDSKYSGLKRIDSGDIPVVVRSYELPEFGLTLTVTRPVVELISLEQQRSLEFPVLAGFGVILLMSLAASMGYLSYVHDSKRLLAYQKQQLDEAQQLARIGSWELDMVCNKLTWSDECRRIFEIDPERSSSNYERFLATIHADDRDLVDGAYRKSLTERVPGEIVHRLSLPSGHVKYVHQVWRAHYDEQGKPLRSCGSVQDITESWQMESRLRLAASVFDNANEGICITDADQRIVDVNPTLCDVTGYSREELIGLSPRVFKSDRQDSAVYAAMWHAIVDHGHWHGELWNRHRNGDYYAVRLTVSAVRDPSGRVTHYIGIMADITESRRQVAQLEQVAHFDTLTGIPNRLMLADRMRQAIAQAKRNGSLLAICYLDLDEFKPINDQYGHEAGDLVLLEISRRLSMCLRGGDTVARLGGDEFALLLLGLHRVEEYESTLRRILEEIKAPSVIRGQTLAVSASIGVALCPYDSSDSDTLLRHADHAMYQAKQAGKNRYHVFDFSDQESYAKTRRNGFVGGGA